LFQNPEILTKSEKGIIGAGTAVVGDLDADSLSA